MSARTVADVLEERARSLARPLAAIVARSGDELDLLVCTVGEERCAMETLRVLHVGRSPPVTPIAEVPSPFVGVVNHAGEILPVLDLGALLGMPRERARAPIIVIGERRADVGLLVDAAVAVVVVRKSTISAPPVVPDALTTVLCGVLADGSSVLDLGALLASPRLFVQHTRPPTS